VRYTEEQPGLDGVYLDRSGRTPVFDIGCAFVL
jgi:hypothetical protein